MFGRSSWTVHVSITCVRASSSDQTFLRDTYIRGEYDKGQKNPYVLVYIPDICRRGQTIYLVTYLLNKKITVVTAKNDCQKNIGPRTLWIMKRDICAAVTFVRSIDSISFMTFVSKMVKNGKMVT